MSALVHKYLSCPCIYVCVLSVVALEEKAISETSSAGPIPLQDFPKSYKRKKEKGILAVEFKVRFCLVS